jgi:hypothetical protein
MLGRDVHSRLRDELDEGVEMLLPGEGLKGGEIKVCDIDRLADASLDSRVIIFDVRSQSLVRMQQSYNKIVGYNRADLNERCFSVCIGDGPVRLFQSGTGLEVFGKHLAKIRSDYWPAAFFYDPLLHYENDEQTFGSAAAESMPVKVPKRFERTFTGGDINVEHVREYFRAEGSEGKARLDKKKRRMKKLRQVILKRMVKAFGGEADDYTDYLSEEGVEFSGEQLRLNVYPFYFERVVKKLLAKAK